MVHVASIPSADVMEDNLDMGVVQICHQQLAQTGTIGTDERPRDRLSTITESPDRLESIVMDELPESDHGGRWEDSRRSYVDVDETLGKPDEACGEPAGHGADGVLNRSRELIVDLTGCLRSENTMDTEEVDSDDQEPTDGGSDSDSDMRKDRGAVRLANGSHDNQGEPCQKVSYTPSKKGGTFGLPMGASVSVPPGIFGKRDTVTCHVASPTERWRFCPTLPSNERITSEIFTLTASQQPLKRPVVLQMPYYATDLEFSELNVKGRWEGEPNWVDVGFISKDGRKPMVELQLDRVGSFVVTVTPKRELFDITTQGCLYNARISRYITVRFPKKAVDTDMPCCLKINPIPTEKIHLAKEQCPHQCGDLERVSEFIDIITDGPRSFRRAATIKLPLPAGLDSDTDDTADVAVLQKMGDTWDIIDNNCRFTKTTVTFDVKTISRFCVAQAKPDRRKRLKEAVKVLEDRTNQLKGEVLAFVSVEKKSWVVLVEVVSEEDIENRTIFRGTKGFRPLKRSPIVKPEPEVFRFSRRTQPKPAPKPKEPEAVIIEDSMKWTIELGQDVKFEEDSEMEISSAVQYFENLPECYRRFKIEPKTDEERALCGSISVVPVNEKSRDNASYLFKLEISEDDVKEYFKPEYVPPPTPEKPEPHMIEVPIQEIEPPKPTGPTVPRFRSLPQDVMDRLTRSNKRPVILEKESKVLTGKSLMALAKVVQEGLTLAVHLDLPDSTITGIGFDALSNGHGMVDVTYKILLHWKRGLKDKKDAAVEQLCLALRDMGRQGAAMAVLERHRDNKELDMSCFEITSV